MNEFAAAMGICNLRHLEGEIAKRREAAHRYRKHLEGVAGLTLPFKQEDVTYNYAYFPVLFDKEVFGLSRDEVAAKLKENGIFARKYFYPLCNAFDCYADRYNPQDTPVALGVSQKVLTLPLYADLATEDVDRICEIILKK